MYHIFFIYSSVDAHLDFFHVLAIVNSAAVNIGVCVFFWVIILSGYMLRSGIAGSYGNSFSFLRSLHAIFHSGGASILNLSSILYFNFCWVQTSGVGTLWWVYSDKVLCLNISMWILMLSMHKQACTFLCVQRTSFLYSFRTDLLERHFLSFPSSENIFISLSFLKDILLNWQFFSLSIWTNTVPFPSGFMVSDE